MARALGVEAMFVERPSGTFELRRGFALAPRRKVLMMEDVVTTGLSSREAIAAIRAAGGVVIAAGCLVDRSDGTAELGVPLHALLRLAVPSYGRYAARVARRDPRDQAGQPRGVRRAALALAAVALAAAAPPAALTRAIARNRFAGVVMVQTGHAAPVIADSGGARRGADAVWRYASVTKQFTAVLVMQEVAAGKLDLDKPVKDYWPDWPQVYADTITIRMLLRHDSGLADPAEDAADADGMPHFYRRDAVDPVAAADGYCAEHPRAQPGSGFHYDNCDFLVLGALLERVTGKPYAALLRERITAPLGLRSIGQFAFGAPARGNVAGVPVHGTADPAVNLGSYGAAGGVYGSPRDLLAFDRALLDHRLLSAEFTRQMWSGEPRLGDAALGAWSFTAPLKGCAAPVALVERRGQIGSVQIRNVIAPALDAALVAFTPREDADFGEIRQGKGLAYDLLSAALCPEHRA